MRVEQPSIAPLLSERSPTRYPVRREYRGACWVGSSRPPQTIVMMTRLGVDVHCVVGSIGREVVKSCGGRWFPIDIWVHEQA